MNHSRAKDLHPSSALAPPASRAVTQLALHIHLGRWLGERKKARAEACLRLAEQPVGEMGERRFQIDERDAFVDCQAFDLSEHRRVRGIEEIAPVAVSRA